MKTRRRITSTVHPELRALLRRIEVADCDCPLYLSCPCGQECDPDMRDCPACLAGDAWIPDNSRVCAAHCRHCAGKCDCPPLMHQPPCRHAREPDPADVLALRTWFRKVFPLSVPGDDVACWQALCLYVDREEYGEPVAPRADLISQSRIARVAKMVFRKQAGMAVRNPWDRWAEDERPEAAVVVSRLMNGAIREEGLKHA